MPDFSLETAVMERHEGSVAGVDEVGRGPLAGPVVAAAVILAPDEFPRGIADSKSLSVAERERLSREILQSAWVGIGMAPSTRIDHMNIRGATLWAMRQAVAALATRPGFVLIDGRDIPDGLSCPAEAFTNGDGRSLSIAAASIVAKVWRDRIMVALDRRFPGYALSANKGYPTAKHRLALEAIGPSAIHRRSFAPVRAALAGR